VCDHLSDLNREVAGTPNQKTDLMDIGELTVTLEALY
jgi:hypothetical protein